MLRLTWRDPGAKLPRESALVSLITLIAGRERAAKVMP